MQTLGTVKIVILAGIMSGCNLFGTKEKISEEVVYDCKATREFTTVLSYLRSEKLVNLDDSHAQGIAMDVTAGCTGAAKRFILVANLLRKAGLDSKSAIDLAAQLAKRNDASAETFALVFKRAFASENLDLDIATSIRLARSMSLDFKGNPKQAGDDYEEIAEFCIDQKKLNLGRPACGDLAKRIVFAGAAQDKEVAPSFIDAFEFLTEKDGPNLSTVDAVKIAEELVGVSHHAPENFGIAYKYAISDSGLKLSRGPAVEFARKVAKHTKYEKKTEKL